MDQYYSRVCGYKLSFEPWNDKFEQRTYLKYCNGAETFYSYDPQRRRLQNLAVNAKAGTIMDNAYTYDAVSNVLSVKNGAPLPQSGKAGGQMNHQYTYDALYRLASATGTYTGADSKTASYTLAMGYDNMQFYYHTDHLGSSSYITNLDGEVAQHIEYVPFGEVFIEERNNIWNTPYLFNAKEFDKETGLYYYGARYYDPRVSLWMSVDPLKEKARDVSPYVYCNQNPIIMFDTDNKTKESYEDAIIDR